MKSKYTFMIIPNSTKKSFQFAIPKFLLILIIFINLFYISNTTIHNYQLNMINKRISAEYDTLSKNLNQRAYYSAYLKNVLDNQNVDLKTLKQELIDEKEAYTARLDEISDLEEEFVYLINEFNYNNNFDIEVASSRALIKGRESVYSKKDIDQEDFISLIKLDIEDNSELIKEVEEKLDFLECKPDLLPVKGRISSNFGWRIHPVTGKHDFHDGIDIAQDYGTPIKAAGAGVVTFSGTSGTYGNVIIISHGYGYKTVYAHNKKNFVKVGEKVNKGEVIAEIGLTGTTTGPHLHFEVHKDGELINPKDILNFD